MARNIGSFATPNNSFMCEPIAQPNVVVAEHEIKSNLVSMVQHEQFGGSASEDVGMHLHNFSELCNMTCIRDYDPDVLKLCLFTLYMRGKADKWLLAFPRGNINSRTNCSSNFFLSFAHLRKLCNFIHR